VYKRQSWFLHRDDGSWRLLSDPLEKLASRVVIPQEIAWRIFTKGMDRASAAGQVQIDGDRELGPVSYTHLSEALDGFAFLNGPRHYSPIVSALRFQHVVGFEWRVDYDPLLNRVTNTTFNGNVRLANKYLFALGHTSINNFPSVLPPSDQILSLIHI